MYKNVGARRQLVSSTKHFLLVAAGIVLAAIRYAKEAKHSQRKYTLISFAAPTGVPVKPAPGDKIFLIIYTSHGRDDVAGCDNGCVRTYNIHIREAVA